MSNKTTQFLPFDFEKLKDRLSNLVDFVSEMENDLFDFEKVQKKYKDNIDAKLLLYDKARRSLTQDLEYLRKLAGISDDIDPEVSLIMRHIMNMGKDTRVELKEFLLKLIKNKSQFIQIIEDDDGID